MERVETFEEIEPEMTRRITSTVWCTLATTDTSGRPRTRIVHPVWDGSVGWLGSRPATPKLRHIERTPWVSLMYWDPTHQQVMIEARAEVVTDRATLDAAWERFSAFPEPYGFDPSPIWPDGPGQDFVAVRFDASRVTLFGAPPRRWESLPA